MKFLNAVHETAIHSKRVDRLRALLLPLLPKTGRVLDVGCGDGWLASLLAERLPNTSFHGIDVLVRDETHVPVDHFDGLEFPFADNSFDTLLFVDVLHHTEHPAALLREAQRVARSHIVLKDHTRNGFLAHRTLRFMDWVGNAHHRVALPYNYLSEQEWLATFDKLNLPIDHWSGSVSMYGRPADWAFARSLHFLARLNVGN